MNIKPDFKTRDKRVVMFQQKATKADTVCHECGATIQRKEMKYSKVTRNGYGVLVDIKPNCESCGILKGELLNKKVDYLNLSEPINNKMTLEETFIEVINNFQTVLYYPIPNSIEELRDLFEEYSVKEGSIFVTFSDDNYYKKYNISEVDDNKLMNSSIFRFCKNDFKIGEFPSDFKNTFLDVGEFENTSVIDVLEAILKMFSEECQCKLKIRAKIVNGVKVIGVEKHEDFPRVEKGEE